jgi:secreted trypsin-like serine protease
MKGLLVLALFVAVASAVPHLNRRHGLENRDFFVPRNTMTWKELARELAKDKIRKQTTNFNYKKGTKKQDENCGLEGKTSSRIVGGQEAAPNQFPWLVALYANAWFCSASLLNEEWVLTAAHCVDGATSWEVYAGTHDLSLGSEPHRVVVATDESYLHPDWNPSTIANDIALIKLPERIEFTDEFIRPSCLPAYSDAGSSLVNDVVTATGWGKLSDDSFTKSDRLNFVKDLPVIANDNCNEYYGIITDGHICIDSTGGHGVCNGDSGGPLNYEKTTGKYTTVGVASFVSGFGCESGLPHGFTRVTEYLDWIETVTGIAIEP